MTTQDAFNTWLLDIAHLAEFQAVHFRPARTAHGWRTPVQGDGVGWPDWVLVQPGRIIVAEITQPGKRLTPEQEDWLELWEQAGAEAYHWTTEDHEKVMKALRVNRRG